MILLDFFRFGMQIEGEQNTVSIATISLSDISSVISGLGKRT